jgi:hypothetical protein
VCDHDMGGGGELGQVNMTWLLYTIYFNTLIRILTLSRLYLIDMGNEGRARDSRPPPPHPPGNLFLTGKSDESR